MGHPDLYGFVRTVVKEGVLVDKRSDRSGLEMHLICEIQLFRDAVSVVHVHWQHGTGSSGGIIADRDHIHGVIKDVHLFRACNVVCGIAITGSYNLAKYL